MKLIAVVIITPKPSLLRDCDVFATKLMMRVKGKISVQKLIEMRMILDT